MNLAKVERFLQLFSSFARKWLHRLTEKLELGLLSLEGIDYSIDQRSKRIRLSERPLTELLLGCEKQRSKNATNHNSTR